VADFEWSWWRFLLGAVGATAPELVRLYKVVTGQSQGKLPPMGPADFGISGLFMALGGLLAVVWGENHALKCLWVGVSLPIIISSFAAQIPPR
jgi:hypothetical protein